MPKNTELRFIMPSNMPVSSALVVGYDSLSDGNHIDCFLRKAPLDVPDVYKANDPLVTIATSPGRYCRCTSSNWLYQVGKFTSGGAIACIGHFSEVILITSQVELTGVNNKGSVSCDLP